MSDRQPVDRQPVHQQSVDKQSVDKYPVIVAIVPAKDAADTVGDTIRAILETRSVNRVVVIDDGSTDDTARVSEQAGAQVIRHSTNMGKAAAVNSGIAATADAEIYLLVDADTGSSAAAATALLSALLDSTADLAIGVLPSAGKKAGFGLVNTVARWGIRLACSYEAVRPLSGQRAIRAELLRSLRLARRYGMEISMTIDSVRAGARLVELPVEITHRHTGRTFDGFVHRARQGIDVVLPLVPRLAKRATFAANASQSPNIDKGGTQ